MKIYTNKLANLFFGALIIAGCNDEIIGPLSSDAAFQVDTEMSKAKKENKITGDIQFIWTNNKSAENGKKPEDLLAFTSITAHESKFQNLDRNNFTYTILNADSTLHRQIVVAINGVYFEGLKGYVTGIVVTDTKGCAGGSTGGHSEGCGGEADDHDGGCSHDADTTEPSEGGCSDDHTDTEGGCSDDHTDTEGGCTDDHTDTGDGCSGSSESGQPGGSGESGQQGGNGNPLSGKNCRIGQIIALKVHDAATPGAAGDGITWKWFSPTGSFVPTVSNTNEWPHLCKKNIIGGNLVVH